MNFKPDVSPLSQKIDIESSLDLKEIREDWGIDTNKLSQNEQAVLIKFIKNLDQQEKLYFALAIDDWDADTRLIIVRMFALAENNIEYEGALFNLIQVDEGTEDNVRVLRVVVEKLSEIFSSIDNIKEVFAKYYQKAESQDEQQIDQLRKGLTKKLFDFIIKISKDIPGDLWDEDVESETVQNLENIKSSILLFGSVFKHLRDQGVVVELKDFKDVEFVVAKGLQSEEIKQIREIYARNYANTPEFQIELLDNFDKIMKSGAGYEDGENTYYILKVDNRVVAFNRFHDLGDDFETGINIKEFGFFNVDSNYQGFQFGEAMMEESLDKEAKFTILQATCTATEAIAERYIKRGFIGTHFVPDYKGIADLSIERDDERNKKYLSKKIEEDEVVSMLKSQPQMGILSEYDFKIEDTDAKIIAFHKDEELPFSLTNEGWILTQYFTRDNVKYAVFEKIKIDEEVDFSIEDVEEEKKAA